MQLNVREGDKYRNVTTWKCLMRLFEANINLPKYATEGIYFLSFTKCLLTHKMSQHVIWTRRTRKTWSKHA